MVAILYPRRLRNLLDVTQPQGTGLPDQGVPLLFSSNSSFVIETIAGGGGGGSFSLGASNIGNTLGDTGITGSRVVLAGIGNLTLSQATDANGGTISISGGTAGAGGVAISASNSLFSSGTVVLTGTGGGVTVDTQAAGTIRISVAAPVAQTVQTQNRFNLTLDGNTAGALAQVSSGTLTLAGGNGITLSQAGNAVTISGNTFSQSVQPETQTFIGGVSASNTLYTSGTVNITGSGIVTVQSGTGQRIIINASQSVQPETQTFIGGIAGSNTTYTSGTVRITGVGGGVTVSSNTGQRIDISVAAQSVQPETQTFVGGVIASDTTYTSGSVRFTGVGGGITVSSNTGQRVDLSVAAQSVQTQNLIAMTLSGNTSGAQALISSGTMTLAGGNNITVSQAGNAVTISGPNVGGAQTGISGIANSQTTYTSGTVSLSELGAITIRSTTGNQFQLSVAAQTAESQSIGMSNIGNTSGTTGIASGAQVRMLFAGGNNVTLSQSLNGASGTLTISAASQTVQTQNVVDVTISGNTSGAGALISSGTLTLAGGNNITVSQAGNAITISGANVGGAQTGISGIIGSDATYTSGTVQFTGSNMITVKSSAGQRIVIDATQSVQTQSLFSAGVSTGGNTAGDTGITGTRMVFVGSQNITLSQATAAAGGTITIQGPTTAAQTNQSGGGYAVGNTYSSSSGTFDARTLSIRGDGIISVAATNSGWRISASQSVQAETQTFVGGIANSQTTYTSGTVSLSELGAITIRSTTGNQFQLSVNAQSVQPGVQQFVVSNTTFSSGTVSISGFGDVTVNTAANIIRISAPAQTAQTGISGIANSQTTYTSGTVSLSELGAITIRSTTGNQYQLSVNSQTEQTQSRFNLTMSGNTSGAGALISSGVMTLAGGNNITLSQAGNAITISAPNLGAGAMSAGVSTMGNTAGATGISGTQMVLVGSGVISLSQTTGANGNTVSILAPASSVLSAVSPLSTSTNGSTISVLAPAQLSVGFSTGGNTSGNTGLVTGQVVLAGGSNITLSGSTNAGSITITISGGAGTGGGGYSAGVSTGGNTAGATGLTGSNMVFVGSSPISLSQTTGASGGTITINAPATSSLSGVSNVVISTNGSTISVGYRDLLADWENMPRQQASLISHVSGFSKTPIYWNDHIDGQLTAKSLAFAISMVTASQPLSVSAHLGVYTFANSTSANLLGSVSEAYVVSSASSVSLSGVRNLIMTGIGTHTALSVITAGEYMIGMMFSATATNAMNFSLVGASGGAGPLGGIYPGTNQLTTGTSQGIQALAGRGSTTVNGMPAAVSQADLVNQGTAASQPLHPWIYIRS